MFDIIEILSNYPKSEYTGRYFLDCHTTSSASLPYISVQDVGANLDWAMHFPFYCIKGFSDIVSGTIDHYMSRNKLTGFVLEAGQHENKDSPLFHEAAIWIALREACGINLKGFSQIPEVVTKLKEEIPPQKTFEIIYRHGLENNDDFKMEEGFKNFQKIEKGELLAIHNDKEIRSMWNAYIFMPLYQPQGNDGFFIVATQ